jgi:hypothetical protein
VRIIHTTTFIADVFLSEEYLSRYVESVFKPLSNVAFKTNASELNLQVIRWTTELKFLQNMSGLKTMYFALK